MTQTVRMAPMRIQTPVQMYLVTAINSNVIRSHVFQAIGSAMEIKIVRMALMRRIAQRECVEKTPSSVRSLLDAFLRDGNATGYLTASMEVMSTTQCVETRH